jgi:hypothetical protein
MTPLISSQERDRRTQTLVTIMRANIREDDRRARLATKRLLFAIEFGAFEESAALWNSIWADVMAQTNSREWNEIMNKGMH